MSSSTQGPLAGIRGADFSRTLAGAHCTTILSDLGAEIIMIEVPTRVPGGIAKGGLPGTVVGDIDARYNYLTRGKKSLSLDINSPRGKEVFFDLVRKLDVVTYNWRPGTAKKLGVDYENLKEINPRIICASITGYGATGPYSDRSSFDSIAAAHTGLLSMCGEPARPPVLEATSPIVDYATAVWAAQGIIAALLQRERTGVGQKVETSLFEVALSAQVYYPSIYSVSGEVPGPPGQIAQQITLGGLFRTQDSYIATGVMGDRMWPAFCRALGKAEWAEDPRFATDAQRFRNKEMLRRMVEEVFVTGPTEHWLEALLKEGLPVAPVNTLDKALADPHTQHLGCVVTIDGVEGKPMKVVRNPVNFSSYRPTYGPAPKIGQHTREVLSQLLGYSGDKIEQLEREGIISTGK